MATLVEDGEWHEAKYHKKNVVLSNGFNDEEEPNFSDPEDYVDDVSDEGNYILY